MNTDEINKYISLLSWHKSEEENQLAIKKLSGIEEKLFPSLVLPSFDKSVWENSALVLKNIGYPKIKNIIPEIIVWLQDQNWPGFDIIIDLLGTVEESVLISNVENILILANDDGDDMWICGIKRLLEKHGLMKKDLLKKEIIEILNTPDWC